MLAGVFLYLHFFRARLGFDRIFSVTVSSVGALTSVR